MWIPLMEAGSGNLALLHCSCLHACLAAQMGHGLDSSTDWIGLDWVRWRKIGLIEWLASGLVRARLQKSLQIRNSALILLLTSGPTTVISHFSRRRIGIWQISAPVIGSISAAINSGKNTTRFCLLWRVVCSPYRPARHSRSAIFRCWTNSDWRLVTAISIESGINWNPALGSACRTSEFGLTVLNVAVAGQWPGQ